MNAQEGREQLQVCGQIRSSARRKQWFHDLLSKVKPPDTQAMWPVGHREVVLLIAEEQAVCSGRLKRKRDTFLPLLEHAIADLHEFRVRFNVGLQIL